MNKIVKIFVTVILSSIFGLTGMTGPFILDTEDFKKEINRHFSGNAAVCRILNEFCDEIYKLSAKSILDESTLDSLIESTTQRVLAELNGRHSISEVKFFLNNSGSYKWKNPSIGDLGAQLYSRPPRWVHKVVWVSSVLCGLFVLYSQVVLGKNPFLDFICNCPNSTSNT